MITREDLNLMVIPLTKRSKTIITERDCQIPLMVRKGKEPKIL